MKLTFNFFFLGLVTVLYTNCSPTKKNIATENNMAASNTSNASLTETYWRLTELMGKPVAMTPADMKMHCLMF